MNLLDHVDIRNHGILDWASYLHAMTLIRPYDHETRVDSLISTVVKSVKPDKSFVKRFVSDEGLNESNENQLMDEKSVDF